MHFRLLCVLFPVRGWVLEISCVPHIALQLHAGSGTYIHINVRVYPYTYIFQDSFVISIQMWCI